MNKFQVPNKHLVLWLLTSNVMCGYWYSIIALSHNRIEIICIWLISSCECQQQLKVSSFLRIIRHHHHHHQWRSNRIICLNIVSLNNNLHGYIDLDKSVLNSYTLYVCGRHQHHSIPPIGARDGFKAKINQFITRSLRNPHGKQACILYIPDAMHKDANEAMKFGEAAAPLAGTLLAHMFYGIYTQYNVSHLLVFPFIVHFPCQCSVVFDDVRRATCVCVRNIERESSISQPIIVVCSSCSISIVYVWVEQCVWAVSTNDMRESQASASSSAGCCWLLAAVVVDLSVQTNKSRLH